MKDLYTINLAKKNIENKKARSVTLILLVGILTFILFMSSFIIFSLKNGMKSLSDRMGADIIVVPEGYDSKITGAILRGEPNTFFFDKDILNRVKKIPGVEKAYGQVYLSTLSAGCCSFPIQVIGIDFSDDFSVKPWLEKQIKTPIKAGQVVVGANIVGTINHKVKFFNQEFEIKGRLAKTGMGFDNSVFMTIEETHRLAKEYEKIINHPVAKKDDISSILVKVEKNKDPKTIQKLIKEEFKKEKVYPLLPRKIMTEVSDSAKNMLVYVYILIALIWILAFFILSLVNTLSVKERKREFATIRILGATKKKLSEVVLIESMLINGTGAVIGSVLSFVLSITFNNVFSSLLNMPFLRPNLFLMILLLIIVIILGTLLGPISSIIAINKINKVELLLMQRDND